MTSDQPFPAEGPDDSDYTGEPDESNESNDEETEQQSEGQVSEVAALDPDEADRPIDPSDATAGAPEGERDGPPVGEAGPDAIPPANAESNEYDKD